MKQRTTNRALLGVLPCWPRPECFISTALAGPNPAKTQFLNAGTYTPLPVENPALQRWKLDASRHTEYKSSGRDLFSESLPAPPPTEEAGASRPDPGPYRCPSSRLTPTLPA